MSKPHEGRKFLPRPVHVWVAADERESRWFLAVPWSQLAVGWGKYISVQVRDSNAGKKCKREPSEEGKLRSR
jgi:hypothetical protein